MAPYFFIDGYVQDCRIIGKGDTIVELVENINAYDADDEPVDFYSLPLDVQLEALIVAGVEREDAEFYLTGESAA